MKFAKKIFVGVVVISMLLSCFALFASAEEPKLPTDNPADVLEYRLYDTFLSETFDGKAEGAYVPEEIDYISFVSSANVVTDGEDKILSIPANPDGKAGYKLYITDENDFAGFIVSSFDLKLGDSAEALNGASFEVVATLGDYIDNIPLLTVNTENMTFSRATFNQNNILYYTEVVAGVAPELGKWYHIDIIYNLEAAVYNLSVKMGDTEIISVSEPIAESMLGVDSFKLYAYGAAGSVAYLDDVAVYEGTFLRNALDPENAMADFLLAIDAYAKYSGTPLTEKIAIADLYAKIYEGEEFGISYTAPAEIEKYDEVCAVVDDAKAYRNRTYAEAFDYHTDNILVDTETGIVKRYNERIEYREAYAKPYYEMFKDVDLDTMPGMSDKYSVTETYADVVKAALKAYDDSVGEVDYTRECCENFILSVDAYDATNKDYTYMTAQYGKLNRLYVDIDDSYKGIAPYIEVFKSLESKLDKINANVVIFRNATLAMKNEQNTEIDPEAPYLTKDFDVLLENYNAAKSVFKNGTVHESLDPESYPGLSDVIARYNEFETYITGRLTECSIFVSMIEGANASAYYVSALNQLNEAAKYLDTDMTNGTLEDYGTVADAIALFDSIKERLEKNKTDAEAYIAAVAAIDINASYDVLKAAVVNAQALKAAGSVTGIEGVEGADVAFASAEAKIASLEKASKNLIETVAKLKSAKTLAERREYIFGASEAADMAENAISGVEAARADLANEIQKYNADVEKINAAFAGLMDGACDIAASLAPASDAGKALGVIVSEFQ